MLAVLKTKYSHWDAWSCWVNSHHSGSFTQQEIVFYNYNNNHKNIHKLCSQRNIFRVRSRQGQYLVFNKYRILALCNTHSRAHGHVTIEANMHTHYWHTAFICKHKKNTGQWQSLPIILHAKRAVRRQLFGKRKQAHNRKQIFLWESRI